MDYIGNRDPMHEECIQYSIPRAWDTSRVKQEEETDKNNASSKKFGRKERGHEEEKSQTRPN